MYQRKRGWRISSAEWATKSVSLFVYMKGTPQFVVHVYLHGWFLGVRKGAMVEKLETICKSPYMFLTHVESAINEF